ncbi:MAG: tetratricopeptide repeat protein [Granulosicoccaceae bacterium]
MQYETEEQQVEALKQWWKENGKAVIAGVVLGALAIAGWGAYKAHQAKQAVAASDIFSRTMDATGDGDADTAAELASLIGNDHADSLYASYSHFAAARAALDNDDLDSAAQNLAWVADNGKTEEVKIIASVRLARVLGAQGKAAAGLSLLPKAYPDSFKALLEEARGDLHVAAGDSAAALTAYQAALETKTASDPESLTMKINELATADAS